MLMCLSTKGQVTIPQAIRERLGIGPGSAVDFICREDGAVELRPIAGAGRSTGQRAVAALRSAAVKPMMSTEELMALTRGWGEPDEDRAHGLTP
jgi:AbrB family looped-hinge helix DNA binding protein